MRDKRGVSSITALILLILITVAVIGLYLGVFLPFLQSNCYTSYAEKFCADKHLTFKSVDFKNEHFSCWTNKDKGEAKVFYIFDEKCR
jgi:flagellin-like protein